jgi:alpha-1,6-mannosyltransferase
MNAGIWYALFQASQFHVIYYASRTLPNMFAFVFSKSSIHNREAANANHKQATWRYEAYSTRTPFHGARKIFRGAIASVFTCLPLLALYSARN